MTKTDSGILVVDKPAGCTSQQVVSRIKRILGVRKAGHGGTLDPMATGVLVVGIGKATRLLGYVMGGAKQYHATIRLGQATTTDDAEGESIGEVQDAGAVAERVLPAMEHYVGEILQVPSSISAIKVNGKRAYALERAGEKVELAARQVHVTNFELIEMKQVGEFLDLKVVVDCSSGTYIRALARDLGKELGVGGHLTALRRTKVGSFDIAAAVALEELSATDLIELAAVAQRLFPTVCVDANQARDISFGRALKIPVPGDPTAMLSSDPTKLDSDSMELLALYRPADGSSVPAVVFI